ncbi:MAG: hypothetical protein KIT83_14150 [Bryobacterales bacterium]|nr:hypothetical protein [Bryobacterales bacterium]
MEANQDFIEFVECLNKRDVEYLLIGAHALAYHGVPRFTGDLDILVRVSPENLRRTLDAIREFGMLLDAADAEAWIQPGEVFQMGVEPNRIVVLSRISGADFEDAWRDRVSAEFHGQPVRLLSKDHLIANKRASGRAKDLADVKQLDQMNKPLKPSSYPVRTIKSDRRNS